MLIKIYIMVWIIKLYIVVCELRKFFWVVCGMILFVGGGCGLMFFFGNFIIFVCRCMVINYGLLFFFLKVGVYGILNLNI